MLDTLILHIPMKSEYVSKVGNLSSIVGDIADYQVKAVPLSFSRDLAGNVTVGDLRHPYESIPSSFASMAMKFNAVNVANTAPYVSLNASVKFLQGHNVYGTSTVENLGKEMLAQLAMHYPYLFVCLDISKANISRIDSTYSAVLPHADLIQPVLRYLSKVSVGHRKVDTRRDFYNTTYFGGKNSRNGGAKIYGKGHEVNEAIAKLKLRASTDSRAAAQLAVYTPELVAYSQNLLRLESSTKRRKLEMLMIPDNFWEFIDYEKNNPDVLHLLWSQWFQPILDSLKGSFSVNVDDSHILDLLKSKLFSYKKPRKTKTVKRSVKPPTDGFYIYYPPVSYPLRSPFLKYPIGTPLKDLPKPSYKPKTSVSEKSFTKAYNAYNFYRLLRIDGYQHVKDRYNRRAFDINVKTLVDCDIPKSDLLNLGEKIDDTYELSDLVVIDYDNQVPFDYVTPVSEHIDVDLDTIYTLLPSNESPVDSNVKSIDDLNSELAQLRDSYNDDLIDSKYGHFYDGDYDYSGYDFADGSPVLNGGQLKKLIAK